MRAANSDGHPSDPHRQGIATDGALVERLNDHAFIEPEVLEAAGFAIFQRSPVDPLDPRPAADLQLVQRQCKGRGRSDRGHIATDYQ
jgi:hypothetical protein